MCQAAVKPSNLHCLTKQEESPAKHMKYELLAVHLVRCTIVHSTSTCVNISGEIGSITTVLEGTWAEKQWGKITRAASGAGNYGWMKIKNSIWSEQILHLHRYKRSKESHLIVGRDKLNSTMKKVKYTNLKTNII